MEPITQGTATSMFGGGQQDDTSTQTTTQGTATGMFGGGQKGDNVAVTATIPAPTFVSSFSDIAPEQELLHDIVAVETPVAEVAVETPVAEVAVETPVAEVAVEQQGIHESGETPVMPLTILTANQEEQTIAQSQAPSTGSAIKGIETLKEAPEFKGIDIDAIIAHTDPTGTGATVTNTSTNTQIPTSSAFKKMAAVGGGLFVLAGVGIYVFSTMFSAGNLSSDGLQADVQQTQTESVSNNTGVITGEDLTNQPTEQKETISETPAATETTTEVSTTTQPSFGATDTTTGADLIEQVGEPSNALVDTVGYITSIDEKISISQTLIKDATEAKQDDAVKYATFAVTKYKEIKQKLENGGYNSNKDVEDVMSKIDQFYNKAIDIMNQ